MVHVDPILSQVVFTQLAFVAVRPTRRQGDDTGRDLRERVCGLWFVTYEKWVAG